LANEISLQKPADLRPGSICDEPKACPRSASLVWGPDLRRKFTAQLDLRRIEGRFAARFDLRRTEGLPSICVVSLRAGLPICADSLRTQLDLRRIEGLPSICVVSLRADRSACAASLRAQLDLRRIEGRFASPGQSASPVCRLFELRRTECFFANHVVT
jgi:hypothetical protein